jgi:hypothetical protein
VVVVTACVVVGAVVVVVTADVVAGAVVVATADVVVLTGAELVDSTVGLSAAASTFEMTEWL